MTSSRCSRDRCILRFIAWSSKVGYAPNGAKAKPAGKAKFYSLTAAGRAQLEKEKENWKRLSNAIDLVVESA